MQAMKDYDLREPEFVDMEVAFRINLYRRQFDGADSFEHSAGGTEIADKLPENCRKTADKLPLTEQERQIREFVLENGSITTSQAAELLDVKLRRARGILGKMVDNHWLRKEGASRNTVYAINIGKK